MRLTKVWIKSVKKTKCKVRQKFQYLTKEWFLEIKIIELEIATPAIYKLINFWQFWSIREILKWNARICGLKES